MLTQVLAIGVCIGTVTSEPSYLYFSFIVALLSLNMLTGGGHGLSIAIEHVYPAKPDT